MSENFDTSSQEVVGRRQKAEGRRQKAAFIYSPHHPITLTQTPITLSPYHPITHPPTPNPHFLLFYTF